MTTYFFDKNNALIENKLDLLIMRIFWLILINFFCCSAIATRTPTPIAPLGFTINPIESTQSFLTQMNELQIAAYERQGEQAICQNMQVKQIINSCLKTLEDKGGDFFEFLPVLTQESKKYSLRDYIFFSSAKALASAFMYPPNACTAKGRFITKSQTGADIIELIKDTLITSKNKRVFYDVFENVLTINIQMDINKALLGYINSQIVEVADSKLILVLKKNCDAVVTGGGGGRLNGLYVSDIYIESSQIEHVSPIKTSSMIFYSEDFKGDGDDSSDFASGDLSFGM